MAEYQLSYESELVSYTPTSFNPFDFGIHLLDTDISSLSRTLSNYTTDTTNRPKKTGAPQPYEVPLCQLLEMP